MTSGQKPSLDQLSGRIDNEMLRKRFRRFVAGLCAVHPNVRYEISPGEARLFFQDVFLCRLVPYRELFHVQIGDSPAWETRVKTEDGCLSAFDAALRRLLGVYAAHFEAGKSLVKLP